MWDVVSFAYLLAESLSEVWYIFGVNVHLLLSSAIRKTHVSSSVIHKSSTVSSAWKQ
jgi:hypothetical protein